MTPELPVYVPRSEDTRTFEVEGTLLYVERTPGGFVCGVPGTGRGLDWVPADAFQVLAHWVGDLPGLEQLPTGYRVDTEATLARIERVLLDAAGHYRSITRAVHDDREAALALLALPRDPALHRTITVRAAHWMEIEVPIAGDATISVSIRNASAVQALEATLAAIGAGGRGHRVAPDQLPAFLRAAAETFGTGYVTVSDGPATR